MINQENTYISEQAVALLEKLGYQRLSPQAADIFRNGEWHTPILKTVLEAQIHVISQFEYMGKMYSFSDNNIHEAISGLEELSAIYSPDTSKKIFDLLLLGRSFEEIVGSDKKSFTLKLIDWDNIRNNKFHVATQFPLAGKNRTIMADIVLFVNGIPLVVIEYNLHSVTNAIQQLVGLQQLEGPVTSLYRYAQLLIAATPEEAMYGTLEDPTSAWSVWNEDSRAEDTFLDLVRAENRLPTASDQILFSLCRPGRLLKLISQFLLWGEKERKIARYHQYLAVRKTMKKIDQRNADGKREGGIISQVQGSGRMITMLLLARNILRKKDIRNTRIIILTDRMDIEEQVVDIFNKYGEMIACPYSGRQLLHILHDNSISIVTTTIQKIHIIAQSNDYKNESEDIFLLIDEMNRMHAGAFYHDMSEIFPNACYIGFTQMPFLRESIEVDPRFRDIIYSYSIAESVRDGITLPILYENRTQNLKPLQLEDPNMAEFNRVISKRSNPLLAESAIHTIAADIAKHYSLYAKGSGLKAMLIAPDQATAIRFQEYFDSLYKSDRQINTATLISADYPKLHFIPGPGKSRDYEPYVINKLKEDSEEVELLIVVDKFLTGLDIPRLAIVYIAKHLPANHLVQAIGSVNRPHPGKKYGILIDYAGIMRSLEQLKRRYFALESYRVDQSKIPVVPVIDTIVQLKKHYTDLDRLFYTVPEKDDLSLMERSLTSQNERILFMNAVFELDQAFRVTISSEERNKVYTPYELEIYGKKLTFYRQLAYLVQDKYNERPKRRNTRQTNQHIAVPDLISDLNDKFSTALRVILAEKKMPLAADIIADYSRRASAIIRSQLVRDWQSNKKVQNLMQNALEDLLIELKEKYQLPLSYVNIDALLAAFIETAKKLY